MNSGTEASVEVVLATCNGEHFLEPQLESLASQSLRPKRVLVYDDCSTDGTVAILQRWALAQPNWIELLPSSSVRLGPIAAFQLLLQNSSAAYVALCDQDDLWLPQRLEQGLALLKTAEDTSPGGSKLPLLLHSDGQLIDAMNRNLNSTLWQWHGASARMPSLRRLALRNQVTGCTILLNRTLLRRALPIPPEAVMHDWWLALIACAYGGLIGCPEVLIKHRRHGANASGPMNNPWIRPISAWQRLCLIQRQWRALKQRCHLLEIEGKPALS